MFCLFCLAFFINLFVQKRREKKSVRGTVIISSFLIIFFGKLPTGDLSITRLHNITFCSLSLSEYWKMTFSLSLSLCGWVRLFWFLLLHVSGQFNIFGDQTWNLHFAVEGLFSSWLFFGLLRFIIYDYIGVLFYPFQLYLFIYGKVLYGRLSS